MKSKNIGSVIDSDRENAISLHFWGAVKIYSSSKNINRYQRLNFAKD